MWPAVYTTNSNSESLFASVVTPDRLCGFEMFNHLKTASPLQNPSCFVCVSPVKCWPCFSSSLNSSISGSSHAEDLLAQAVADITEEKGVPPHSHLSLHNDVIVKTLHFKKLPAIWAEPGAKSSDPNRDPKVTLALAMMKREKLHLLFREGGGGGCNLYANRIRWICLGRFDVIIWTSSPSSVIVKGWKAATASFKESKMTNEFTRLSGRQRRLFLRRPRKITCREGKRTVCHMSDYLLQMRNDSVS